MPWIVTHSSRFTSQPLLHRPRGVSVTRGVLQVRDTSAVNGGGLAAVGDLTLSTEREQGRPTPAWGRCGARNW